MEVKTNDYRVWYDSETAIVNFQGLLREGRIADYAPLDRLLDRAIELKLPSITINLQSLEFIDSSAISILSRFVIKLRKNKTFQLTVKGSTAIPYQSKILDDWQRLMPTLIREY